MHNSKNYYIQINVNETTKTRFIYCLTDVYFWYQSKNRKKEIKGNDGDDGDDSKG